MANTYAIYTGNGSTTTYAIPVSDWISDSHIIVQLDHAMTPRLLVHIPLI
jgi:hypothetical protein